MGSKTGEHATFSPGDLESLGFDSRLSRALVNSLCHVGRAATIRHGETVLYRVL